MASQVSITVRFCHDSPDVCATTLCYYLSTKIPFEILFRAVTRKKELNHEHDLLFFNENLKVLDKDDMPETVGMKTGDIITCTLCIKVKIESPDRAPVVFDAVPWETLAVVAEAYFKYTESPQDLVFFTSDGTLANEQALLSSDVTLTACTDEDGFPPTTTVPPGSHSSSWLRNMGSKVVPPEIAIQTWINEVTKAEARRAGRIIRQWPESLEDDADVIVGASLLRFLLWRSTVRMRTRDIEQDPFAQHYGLDQEIEDMATLKGAWEIWRTDLIGEWDSSQQHRLRRDFQEPNSLQAALHQNRAARLLREAKIIFLIGAQINTWKPLTPGCRKHPEGHLGTVVVWDILRVPIGDALSIMLQWKTDRRRHESGWIMSCGIKEPGENKSFNFRNPSRTRKAARKAGAAEIEFLNELDDEVPPNIGRLFVYLERSYCFEVGVNPEITLLTGCRCEDGTCCSARICHHEPLSFSERTQQKGLFGLDDDPLTEVVECNSLCACPPECANRIAQRPRRIAIQIFKTERCGWGVRAVVNIKAGTMVGIYTGLIIRRQDLENLPPFRLSYCFNLDAMEKLDDEAPENSYTVDAFGCGNWTRFINHCCEPNLKVVPVMYDTAPKDNLPYLSFVATENITAYSELTFDYNPARQREWKTKKYKEKGTTKRKRSKTETCCLCGANECRGWL